jgi:hypothetical protein
VISTSTELVARYREDGYVVVPGATRDLSSARLLATLKIAIARFHPAARDATAAIARWSDAALDELLVTLRERDPAAFSAIYDTMQTSFELQRFVGDDRLASVAAMLLDDEPDGLCMTGAVLRLDPPHDRRNVLEWHQEAGYYPQNVAGENGTVVWMPLADVSAERGPMDVCVGSHALGTLAHSPRAHEMMHSDLLRVSDEIAGRYRQASLALGAGDAVFMNMATIHRSGINSSGGMRFTALVRFHRVRTSDFCPGLIRFVPNKSVLEARERSE